MVMEVTSKEAYKDLQGFINDGSCTIKQWRENGGLVLSLEYSKACDKPCQKHVFVQLFLAAREYLRLNKSSAVTKKPLTLEGFEDSRTSRYHIRRKSLQEGIKDGAVTKKPLTLEGFED